MEHDVFISYSMEDQKVVEGLSAYLEQNGIRCFIAYRDIPKGIDWAEAITNAIEKCRLMIVVFSEHFNHSTQVNREITLCMEEGKPLLTFKIQNAAFTGTKKYYLQNLNWIDAFPNPENYFGKLCDDVLNILPEKRLNKKEIAANDDFKKDENSSEAFKPTISKDDIGLLKILSLIGVFMIPLGGGLLLGALYGIFHAITGINKNLVGATKSTGITVSGLIWFSLHLILNIVLIVAVEKGDYNFFIVFFTGMLPVGIFGIIYSVVWINRLNATAVKQGYNIDEIQAQFFAKNKRTIIIGIIAMIAVLCILIWLKF